MNAYRRHFISLNMILVGAVLLVTLLLVGIFMARNEYDNMRQTMLETLEPFQERNGSFSYTPDQQPDSAPPVPTGEMPMSSQNGERLSRQPDSAPAGDALFGRCITVFYSDGKASVISGTNGAEPQTVLAAATDAVAAENSFGYLKEYDMFYLAAGREDSAKLSLYPAGYLRRAILETALYLLGAFLLTMLACYAVSRYISAIAIRPVELAMRREKQFVADISHDLKTPLAVMQACQHIMLENSNQTVGDVAQWIEKSSAAIENMKSLIDDMLTLNAVDTAQRLPKREPVNFSSVVTKAVLQMEAMAYDRGITLETRVQENQTVTGDADALLRVASGLIENALKYEPENGHIAVTLENRGRKTVLTVENSGAVIPPEDLPHIFERFYRSDKARTSRQGHGLGLAIIKRTVELMDGRVEVSSSPEQGTVFSVLFG